MNTIKKFAKKLTVVAVAAVALTVTSAQAGFYFQPTIPTKVVDSLGAFQGPTNAAGAYYSATNQMGYGPVFGTNAWPGVIYPSTIVTNVTPFTVANGSMVALQWNLTPTNTMAASVTNVTCMIGRSVQTPNSMPAGAATNSTGTGLNIEWFQTITNQLPSAVVAGTVCTANYVWAPPVGFSTGVNGGAAAGQGGGGFTTYYIGWITTPGTLAISNYQFWASNSQQ